MYVSGMHPYFGFFFATTTLIIAVPTAIKVYNWVLTLWRGDIHLTIPMLFALAFIVTFVNGGLTGLFLGNVVVDVPLSDTMFVVAHFHMVMGVAPILVIFGAIYHWYPKITGRMLNEAMGQFHFWVTFLGAYLIFFPMHYVGLMGVPRRYTELGETAFMPNSAHTLNAFITRHGAHRRLRAAGVPVQPDLEHPPRQGGRRQSVARHHARMADAETPPAHGNFGKELPVVYRWAYDYSVPGAKEDFIPQNDPGRLRGGQGHCMSVILVFLLVIAGIAGWWLSQQRLMSKPWLEQGSIDRIPGTRSPAHADGQDRPRRLPGRRRLPVRAVHQRLFHAHGAVGLAAAAGAAACCGSTPACWC